MKNESAFPIPANTSPDYKGLTKLEWFSGQAMQGLCANTLLLQGSVNESKNASDARKIFFDGIKDGAVALAKELIKQLEAQK